MPKLSNQYGAQNFRKVLAAWLFSRLDKAIKRCYIILRRRE